MYKQSLNPNEYQAQLFMLDNRLELKTAQAHCFNVAGRMLCAAEHLSYLLKNQKLEKNREIFGYYNSYKFADTKNKEELKSNMIEQLDNFRRMKKKFKLKFDINLILPLNKDELIKYFNCLTNGLENNYKKLYDSMLNLLINNKKDDSQIIINNYYSSFDKKTGQKLEFDPKYLIEYYPEIENNITNLRNQVKQKFNENRKFKPKMIINDKNLKVPLSQAFDENLENENNNGESIFNEDDVINKDNTIRVPKDSYNEENYNISDLFVN